MEGIRTYLLSVVAVCMLSVLCLQLVKQAQIKKVLRFVTGLLVLLIVVSPLVSLDEEQLRSITEKMDLSVGVDRDSLSQEVSEQLAQHVQSTAEAYIEEQAAQQGAVIQARVTVTQEQYPVPYSVVMIGTITPEQKEALTQYLSLSLGIPYERQEWK